MSEQQPTSGRKYLTISELSESSGFSVTQIRRLAAAKKIAFFQPGGKGGKLLFPPNALECHGEENPFAMTEESEKPLPGRRPKWMAE